MANKGLTASLSNRQVVWMVILPITLLVIPQANYSLGRDQQRNYL